MRTLTKQQKVENCLVAINMVHSMHDNRFMRDLGRFANRNLIEGGPSDPGAVGCLGAWCAQHPHFTRYGVYANPDDGSPLHVESLFDCDVGELLFGEGTMFVAMTEAEHNYTPKQACIKRLERALNRLYE